MEKRSPEEFSGEVTEEVYRSFKEEEAESRRQANYDNAQGHFKTEVTVRWSFFFKKVKDTKKRSDRHEFSCFFYLGATIHRVKGEFWQKDRNWWAWEGSWSGAKGTGSVLANDMEEIESCLPFDVVEVVLSGEG